MHAALAVAVASIVITACSTSDHVLAWEEKPESESTVIPETRPQPTVCGDGVREEGEACDDGNLSNGDGCSSACTVEDAPVEAACPGTPFPLSAADPAKRVGSVTGDTSGQKLTLDSPACGGGNGKDIVYALTSDVPGVARIRLEAVFDALLYVRTACADSKTELTCKSVPTGGGKTDVAVPIAKGQTVYLVVDGVGGKSGTFKLDVEVGATSCGDGIAQHPEQCDDGNLTDGDGCSGSCQLETTSAAAGKCPGASYTLVGSTTGPKKISFGGDISILANTMGAFGCSGGLGRDQVYAITPTTSGAITAVLHASYPAALLHVRGECFSGSTELDCQEGPVAGVPMRTTFPVEAQKTYYLFADTDTTPAKMTTAGTGLYTLDVTLAPATCGNGVLESPEECDDGDPADGDGCSATCTLEPLPDGIDGCPGAAVTLVPGANGAMTFRTTSTTVPLTPGVESCSNDGRKDAVYTFQAPFDGWLTAKAKGNFNLTLNLRSNCLAETTSSTPGSIACGNAFNGDDEERVTAAVTAGTTYHLIVDGGFADTNKEGVYTLDLAMTPSVCGNGVTEGGEQCDDGAHDPGDGCTAECTIEPTPSIGDTCTNPQPLTLVEGAPGEYSAFVSGGNWHLPNNGTFTIPLCASTPGNQAYYSVVPPINGVLVADVDATYNIVPGVRLTCPHTGASYIACTNRNLGPGAEKLALPVTAGTQYIVILDAPNNQFGRFTMNLTLKGESCGDGLLASNGSEQCDDGNLVAGDGCSPTCTVEPLAGVDTCPGYAVALTGIGTATRERQITVSTAALANNYAGSCGGNDRDGVVAVTSDIGGTMVAELTSAWPAVFYARSSCMDSSSQLACVKGDPAKPTDNVRTITQAVLPNVPVFFFIDGLAGASGPATLNVAVTP